MKSDKDSPPKTAAASRRRYGAEFKHRLVRMSLAPGASAAKIALKHQLNANLLFKWRRLYLREISGGPAAEPMKLLPVTIRECTDISDGPAATSSRTTRSPTRTHSGTIDIELPAGHIRVKGAVDIELLRSVVQMVRDR